MKLEAQGVRTITIVTESFFSLAAAQAKARGRNLHFVVVTHPVGGLRSEELENRAAQAESQLE